MTPENMLHRPTHDEFREAMRLVHNLAAEYRALLTLEDALDIGMRAEAAYAEQREELLALEAALLDMHKQLFTARQAFQALQEEWQRALVATEQEQCAITAAWEARHAVTQQQLAAAEQEHAVLLARIATDSAQAQATVRQAAEAEAAPLRSAAQALTAHIVQLTRTRNELQSSINAMISGLVAQVHPEDAKG